MQRAFALASPHYLGGAATVTSASGDGLTTQTDDWSIVDETHSGVAADGRTLGPVKWPQPPAVGALVVRTERRVERHSDVLVLWLSGSLDMATSALLDREFDAQACQASHVVVDLTGLDFIDCNGLETLVRTRRRATENDQRASFRQGPYAGRLPLELTHDAHRRPLVIGHEAP